MIELYNVTSEAVHLILDRRGGKTSTAFIPSGSSLKISPEQMTDYVMRMIEVGILIRK